MTQRSQRPAPAGIALVVCDNIYQEPNGKIALVGLFNAIASQRFPTRHNRLCVYASVTDVDPKSEFRVEIVHSETDARVAGLKGPPPRDADRTSICDFQFLLDGLVFQEPGRYYIQFWGNDNLLMQRPFEVVRVNPSK